MKYIKKTHRGEVWMADLGTNIGSEQNGLRPCLVLNQAPRGERTVFIVPASSKRRPQSYTLAGYNWLLHQSRAIDTRRLIRNIERLNKEQTNNILESLLKFLKNIPIK